MKEMRFLVLDGLDRIIAEFEYYSDAKEYIRNHKGTIYKKIL